jgi:hypothetical protein
MSVADDGFSLTASVLRTAESAAPLNCLRRGPCIVGG